MDGRFAPMMDGWGWLWQLGPVSTLLVLLVLALVVFTLLTTTRVPVTLAVAPNAKE